MHLGVSPRQVRPGLVKPAFAVRLACEIKQPAQESKPISALEAEPHRVRS
jgi:hypothetical protein